MLAAAGLAALATAVVGASSAGAAAPVSLVASVSDPLNISLKIGAKKVSKLKPGTYLITVQDKAADHNFHLKGPGVNKSTSVSGKATTTWTVTLKTGSYTYVCDPHASFMKGAFSVGSANPPPPPPPPPPAQAKCKVPKVVGRKLPAARRTITRARCRVGRVRRARSLRARGRVVSQSPRAGATRPRGARVNLVVSRGRR
jgi:plastocyanin